jgi:hypothetical protein
MRGVHERMCTRTKTLRARAHTHTIGAMEETLEVVVGDPHHPEVLMIEEVLQELEGGFRV